MSYQDVGNPSIQDTSDFDEVADGAKADADESAKEIVGAATMAPDETAPLPLDVVFDILKNRRRRLVIHYLTELSETTTLSDLAEYIAAVENDKPEEALTSAERKRVYVCLYQCHLPKMDDAGVVVYESERGTVKLGDNTTQLLDYVYRNADTRGRSLPEYAVLLATIGLAALLAQRLIYPSALAAGLIVGVLLGLFIKLAAARVSFIEFLPRRVEHVDS